jgi:hypothetical protein
MPDTVQLLSPPGYKAVTPLDRAKHAGMGIKPARDFEWCAGINAVYINAVEFFKAGLDFPIAFARDEKSGEFLPMAILGLKQKQNLFVLDDQRWRPNTYVPAYFRRFPFCIAELPPPKDSTDGQPNRLVCVQEDQLSKDSPTALFKANGDPTPQWEPIQKLLEAIEAARQQTRALMKRLDSLQLLVPFDAVAMPRQGDKMHLKGMFRVDEEKLSEIPGKEAKAMTKRGEMRAIYAHLLSLENFARLLDYSQQGKNGN